MNSILYEQSKLLIDDQLPSISNISNLIAFLYHELDHVNWLGFYLCDNKNSTCYLGPFQGKVACTKIKYGSGVVGTCAASRITIRVPNVHEFAGHIACDCSSNSEICIPIQDNDNLYAILDIDSDILDRFDLEDQVTLEMISKLFVQLFEKERL